MSTISNPDNFSIAPQALQRLAPWQDIQVLPYQTSFVISHSLGLEPYPAGYWVRAALTVAAIDAGGATALPGIGSYLADNGKLCPEKIHLIYCSYPSLEHQLQGLEKISQFLQEYKRACQQECLYLALNNQGVLLR